MVSSLTSWWWWWSLELAEGLALWSSFQALKDPQGHQGLGTNLQKALRGVVENSEDGEAWPVLHVPTARPEAVCKPWTW